MSIKTMKFNIYVDGSCINNGKKNPIGAIGIFFADNDINNCSKVIIEKSINITNQSMELYACITALEKIVNKPDPKIVYLYTDSLYVNNCINKWYNDWCKNGWKTKKGTDVSNKELILQLHTLCDKMIVIFKHIKSHQHEPDDKNSEQYQLWYGNFMADKLAQLATHQYQQELKKIEINNLTKQLSK